MSPFSDPFNTGVACAFFFVLTALARGSVSIGLVERPLVLGLLAGWLTDRWDVALPLAVTLELFWLDCIRLGAVIPPAASLSYLLLLPLTLLLDLHAPAQLPLPLLLCLGCAHAGSWLERWERLRSNFLAEGVTRWSGHGVGGISPERAMVIAIGAHCIMYFALYIVCYGTLYVMLSASLKYGVLPSLPLVSWNVMYGVGLMGAVLSLRTRRAYVVLACALFFTLLAHM